MKRAVAEKFPLHWFKKPTRRFYVIRDVDKSPANSGFVTTIVDGAVFPKKHNGHIIRATRIVAPCCESDIAWKVCGQCSCRERLEMVSQQFIRPATKRDEFRFKCERMPPHFCHECPRVV